MKATPIYDGFFFRSRFADASSSWNEHIPFASVFTRLLKPSRFVELGVYRGTSYFSFCKIIQEAHITCSCYGVDTWKGESQTGCYSDEIYKKVVEDNVSFAQFSELLRMPFSEAAKKFSQQSIDLLHIDGFHSYEAVRADFETWLPKISSKGVILLHDVNVRRDDFGVWKLWDEIQSQYQNFLFPFGCGLGVLLIGTDVPQGCHDIIEQLSSSDYLVKLFELNGLNIAKEASIIDRENQNHSLRMDIQKTLATIRDLEKENNTKTEHISNLDNQINILTQNEESLQQQYQQQIIAFNEVVNQLNHLRVEFSKEKKDLEQQYLSLQDQYMHYKNKFDSLTSSPSIQLILYLFAIRDNLLPIGSKKRFFVQCLYHHMRHPFQFIKKLRWKTLAGFFRILFTGNFSFFKERWKYHFGQSHTHMLIQSVNPIDHVNHLQSIPFVRSDTPIVSILIPVYNQYSHTRATLISLSHSIQGIQYEIFLLDDCSTDQHISDLEQEFPGIQCIRNAKNLGFLRNVNSGAEKCKGTYLYLLNNDVILQQDTLSSLIQTLEQHPKASAVGSRLVYPNGRLQEAGGIVFSDGSAWNFGRNDLPDKPEYNYLKEVDYVSGASLLIRRADWEALNGFDLEFMPAYAEDTDLAFRLRKLGRQVLYQPESVLVHFEGVSHGTDETIGLKAHQTDNLAKLARRHAEVLAKNHFPNGQEIFLARDRSRDRRHILFVDHYVPQPDRDAGSRSSWLYMQLMTELGFMIHFIPDNHHRDEQYASRLQQLGVEVLYDTSEYRFDFSSWIKANGRYLDIAILSRPHIAIEYIDQVKAHSKARIIYFAHDLQHVSLARCHETTGDAKALQRSKTYRAYEEKLTRLADETWVFSSTEAAYLVDEGFAAIVRTIPLFFYDQIPAAPAPAFSERPQAICFVAGFRHPPNADALLWFVREIWPLVLREEPGSIFYVGGAMPPEEAASQPNVECLGFLSDDELEALYQKVRVAVVPLRYGAGVKGKTVEPLCRGVPVVGTSFAAEGVDGLDEVVRVSDNSRKLADEIILLLRDEQAWMNCSNQSVTFCRSHFSKQYASEIIEKILMK